MPVFLTVLEGSTPEDARPILATRDPAILRLVAQELHRRLTGSDDGSEPFTSPVETDRGRGFQGQSIKANP